ncbi:hypothetical protein NM208_g9176 [Fusarium decemcellulare]|uniref:Uncharacterized protein n=1 Tax=Fusarium decemcellulare TaxID=57161 RepID=A0ACC1S2L0_9HYPO|nr:hypothetical protein NM208_g9176 [Fusarium decemcellulare]
MDQNKIGNRDTFLRLKYKHKYMFNGDLENHLAVHSNTEEGYPIEDALLGLPSRLPYPFPLLIASYQHFEAEAGGRARVPSAALPGKTTAAAEARYLIEFGWSTCNVITAKTLCVALGPSRNATAGQVLKSKSPGGAGVMHAWRRIPMDTVTNPPHVRLAHAPRGTFTLLLSVPTLETPSSLSPKLAQDTIQDLLLDSCKNLTVQYRAASAEAPLPKAEEALKTSNAPRLPAMTTPLSSPYLPAGFAWILKDGKLPPH